MKKVLSMMGVALVVALGANAATPNEANAALGASVCQFYRGDPLCKTVEETSCIGASAGLEGRMCRTSREYWYWS